MQEIQREIFVGGCSRSGTTLLGAILGAHSDCVCSPESHFKISVLRHCQKSDGTINLNEALHLIRRHWRFKLWQIDVDPDAAPTSSYARLLGWLVAVYAERQGLSGSIWVDHTPENINYAPILLRLFPRARVVHIVRDGRAVTNSILPLDWGPNTVIRAASWWQAMVNDGLALERSFRSGRVVRVSYEQLLCDSERTIRRLCDELSLPYEPRMVQADGFQPPSYTVSQHQLIGRGPDPERAERWRTALTDRQVELFESLAGDLLRELGYDLVYGTGATPPTHWERALAAAKEWALGDIVNTVRWLVRSYPIWLSWDFLRVLPDTWVSYRKAELDDLTQSSEVEGTVHD